MHKLISLTVALSVAMTVGLDGACIPGQLSKESVSSNSDGNAGTVVDAASNTDPTIDSGSQDGRSGATDAGGNLTQTNVDKWWDRIDAVLKDSVGQNPNGSWNMSYGDQCASTHPLMRYQCGVALGYTYAYEAFNNGQTFPDGTVRSDYYRKRAISTLDYIYSQRQTSGNFLCHCSVPDNAPGNISGGTMDTGFCGRALARAYRAFKGVEPAKADGYKNASAAAIAWYANDYGGGNANWYVEPLSHIVEHIRAVAPDTSPNDDVSTYCTSSNTTNSYCAKAISFAKKMITGASSHQTSGGYWSDAHNQIYFYHMMMTRGLIDVYSILDASHPYRNTISSSMHAALDHIAQHQRYDNIISIDGPLNGAMWWSLSRNPPGNTPGDASPANCSGGYTLADGSGGSCRHEGEDDVIWALAIADRQLQIRLSGASNNSVTNMLNGLVEFQLNRRYTGKDSTGKIPSNELTVFAGEEFSNKVAGAGYLTKYVRTPPGQP